MLVLILQPFTDDPRLQVTSRDTLHPHDPHQDHGLMTWTDAAVTLRYLRDCRVTFRQPKRRHHERSR